MNAAELRRQYLGFFVERGHKLLPSSSLVPNDPTLLFTAAGMVQFKDIFWGRIAPAYPSATTVQKCFRTTDIENVGKTAYHHTFFEMLGNFSFGDYFKEEVIEWAWEFLTDVLGFDADRLWVTVHHEDEAAAEIWRAKVGFPAERIVKLGDKDNFWGPAGDSGPCGPCSEIHVDMGEDAGCGRPDCRPGCDCRRYFEVWNLVFPQFVQSADGTRKPLARPGIDTGMGLERVAAVLQGASSVYEIDIMRPIVDAVRREVREADGTLPPASEGIPGIETAVAVIADHARAMTFTIAENILPSNEAQGYVVRRVIRRAVRRGLALGISEPFLYRIAGVVVEAMKDGHPHLEPLREHMALVVRSEEERFHATLTQGSSLFEEIVERVTSSGGKVIAGADAFTLYDTYGFPPDLTSEMAAERGLSVDMPGFDAAMEEQKERGRRGSTFSTAVGAREWTSTSDAGSTTEFVGYDLRAARAVEAEESDSGVLSDGIEATAMRVRAGLDEGLLEVALDRTPFYAESGGQVADSGWLQSEGFEAEVVNVYREDGLVVHVVRPRMGGLEPGARVTASVDLAVRRRTEKNHTATHLMQAALRRVLGDHVHQSGSWVGPERLRFDFTHFAALSDRELVEVEDAVNAWIRADVPVTEDLTTLECAIERGATALFDEKYGDTVRTVSVEGVSLELCGGTHVARTGEIGAFRIVSESSVAAGTRRIEALTGADAVLHARSAEASLHEASAALKVRPDELAERVRDLSRELSHLTKELATERRRSAGASAGNLADGAVTLEGSGVRVLAVRTEAEAVPDLRAQADGLREKFGEKAIGVLAAVIDGKPSMIAFATDDLAKGGRVTAGDVIRSVAGVMGARGGGKPHMAQAGGGDASKLEEALAAVEGVVRGLLGDEDSAPVGRATEPKGR